MKTLVNNNRLKNYNRSNNGAYFITICSYNCQSFLEDYKKLIDKELANLPSRFSGLTIDLSIVMPNHIHSILILNNCKHDIPSIIRTFKSITTIRIKRSGFDDFRVWHPDYYEHAIRDKQALKKIREYINNNPLAEKPDWKSICNPYPKSLAW